MIELIGFGATQKIRVLQEDQSVCVCACVCVGARVWASVWIAGERCQTAVWVGLVQDLTRRPVADPAVKPKSQLAGERRCH